MNPENRPKVGVGVIVLRDGKVLMGLRKGSHGEGTWCFPGGHLEYGESPEECGAREALEETGIIVEKTDRVPFFTNDIFLGEEKHYITLFVVVREFVGDPKIREPEKCERWEWFPWDQMPENIFLPM